MVDDFDFGFSLVSTEEVSKTQTEEVVQPVSSVSVEEFDVLQKKLDTLMILVQNISEGDDSSDLYTENDQRMERLEEKVDRLIELETTQVTAALQEQGSSIRAVIDEVEERKKELNDKYKTKLGELETLIIPLLKGLMKNPEKEYIYWPNRLDIIQKQIDKVYSITKEE